MPPVEPYSNFPLTREDLSSGREEMDQGDIPLCRADREDSGQPDSSVNIGAQQILVQSTDGGGRRIIFQPDLEAGGNQLQRSPSGRELYLLLQGSQSPFAIPLVNSDIGQHLLSEEQRRSLGRIIELRDLTRGDNSRALTTEESDELRELESSIDLGLLGRVELAAEGHGSQGFNVCRLPVEAPAEADASDDDAAETEWNYFMTLFDTRLDNSCSDPYAEGSAISREQGISALDPGANITPTEWLNLLESRDPSSPVIMPRMFCFSGSGDNQRTLLSRDLRLEPEYGQEMISYLTGMPTSEITAAPDAPEIALSDSRPSEGIFDDDRSLGIAQSLRSFFNISLSERHRIQRGTELQEISDRRGARQIQLGEEGQQIARDTQSNMKYMYIMFGAMMYFQARQMGLTRRFDSILSNTWNAVRETPGRLWSRDFTGLGQRWAGIFRLTSSIMEDFTEASRNNSAPLTDTGRKILNGFDRGQSPHVVLSGPSGSGKGYAVETAAAAAVQGRSNVEAFRGHTPRYVTISAGAIVREAGSWQNGAESIFFRTLNGLAGEHPVIVHLTEADAFARAGQGYGNEPLNLLARLYDITEGKIPRYRNLHFILDSTRWQTILEAAPDLVRRTGFVENMPLLPQELREAIRARTGGAGIQSDILARRYTRVNMTSGALDAITALGHLGKGAPPTSHIDVMDTVVNEIIRANPDAEGRIEITEAHVIRTVAARTRRAEAEVQAELRGLLEGGIENNPRIQLRIVDAFYREYEPHPDNGRQNPLDPTAVDAAEPHEPRPPEERERDSRTSEPRRGDNGAEPTEAPPVRELSPNERVQRRTISRIAGEVAAARENGNRTSFSGEAIGYVWEQVRAENGTTLRGQEEMARDLFNRSVDLAPDHVREIQRSHVGPALNAWSEYQAVRSRRQQHISEFLTAPETDPAIQRVWERRGEGTRDLLVSEIIDTWRTLDAGRESPLRVRDVATRHLIDQGLVQEADLRAPLPASPGEVRIVLTGWEELPERSIDHSVIEQALRRRGAGGIYDAHDMDIRRIENTGDLLSYLEERGRADAVLDALQARHPGTPIAEIGVEAVMAESFIQLAERHEGFEIERRNVVFESIRRGLNGNGSVAAEGRGETVGERRARERERLEQRRRAERDVIRRAR